MKAHNMYTGRLKYKNTLYNVVMFKNLAKSNLGMTKLYFYTRMLNISIYKIYVKSLFMGLKTPALIM